MQNSIILCNKTCIFDKQVYIYGQYSKRIDHITMSNNISFLYMPSNNRPDFLIELEYTDFIEQIIFHFEDESSETLCNIHLEFPFNGINLDKDTSAIISTMCKDYSHILDEWIQYNIKLGFSNIVIFDNNDKKTTSMIEFADKYKGKVLIVDFPYSPFSHEHWSSLQRLALSIGVSAFKRKCRNIALIDADEFIHLPENPNMNIETFLNSYNNTIRMQSNLLTNVMSDEIIHNNVINIAEYVGENKYTKVILNTSFIQDVNFIFTPHYHDNNEITLGKDKIIHYHAWLNERCKYEHYMEKTDVLQAFLYE